MADTTTNYKLNKPLKNEYVNIDVLNQNMDIIDSNLKSIDDAVSSLDNTKAPLASPTLTGTPKAPTASSGTNTTQIATTAFTQTEIYNHNTSSLAHTDIRNLITDLTTRLNSLADSDDTTLDQLSEIVAYIKSNRTLIENVTTNKVNVSDIIDNLTSTATNKPLSANQGKILKDLIDTLESTTYTEATALTKLTSGEKLSVAFGKISKAVTDLISHIANKSNPHSVTKSQVGLGNVENKSSETIRSELTKENITSALGYTPPTSNTTYGIVSKTANGLAPQLPNETTTTKYLRQDGTWTVPPNTTYTSLKNPYALTIQGNGTTLTNGTYDGSAAKTVNITATAIGAATSSHTHSNMLPSTSAGTYTTLADFWTYANSIFKGTSCYMASVRCKLTTFIPTGAWYRCIVSAQNLLGNGTYDVTGSIIADSGTIIYYGKVTGGKTDSSDLKVTWGTLISLNGSIGTTIYYQSSEPSVNDASVWIS